MTEAKQTVTRELTEDEQRAKERQIELNRIANEAEVMGFDTGPGFLHLQRVALVFSQSSMVPEEYRGNQQNCCIAVNLARRLKADELMVMQNLFIVYGRPGWSSQFLIAMFNNTDRFSPITYEFFGEKGTDTYGCRAKSVHMKTGEEIIGPDVTIGIAKAEGWYDRKSKDGKRVASKWPTMPDLMLRYRSAAWMIRTTAPELTMGIGTVEEIVDTGGLVDSILEETMRRDTAKKNAQAAAAAVVANSDSSLGALVDSDANQGKDAEIKDKPEAAQEDRVPILDESAQATKPRGRQRQASMPMYGEEETEPFSGGLPVEREPGEEG